MTLPLIRTRIDEILRLTWEDVNFENATIALWTRKRKDGNMEVDLLPIEKLMTEYADNIMMIKNRELTP